MQNKTHFFEYILSEAVRKNKLPLQEVWKNHEWSSCHFQYGSPMKSLLLETLPYVFIFCQSIDAFGDNSVLAISNFPWQNISEEPTPYDPIFHSRFDDGEKKREKIQNKISVCRSPIFKIPNQYVCSYCNSPKNFIFTLEWYQSNREKSLNIFFRFLNSGVSIVHSYLDSYKKLLNWFSNIIILHLNFYF